MKNTLSQDLHQFTWDRIENQCQTTLLKSDRYVEASNKVLYLIKLITKNAPENLKLLLDEYDESCAEKESIIEATVYKQGLNDGIRFAHTLSSIDDAE